MLQTVRNFLHNVAKRLDPQSEHVLLNSGFIGPSHSSFVSAAVPELALRNSAVYSCVKLLVETASTVPLRLVDKNTKEDVPNHPVSKLLLEPNPEQTLTEFLEMFLVQFWVHGNAFAEKVMRGSRVAELWPIPPASLTVSRSRDGVKFYEFTPSADESRPILTEHVLQFSMFGTGSLVGLSPIWIAQKVIELALTQEKEATHSYSKGLNPGFVVEVLPEKSNPLDIEDIKTQILTNTVNNRGLFIPEGYKLTPLSVNFQQAQFVELKEATIRDISRVWRVPPSKLGVAQTQPNANAEMENLAFFQDTLRPVFHKLEKRLERSLLTPSERERYQLRFNVRSLLRGDIKTQTDQWTRLYQIGVYNRNEIRDMDDLSPIEGGDEYQTPTNMTTEQVPGADQGTNNPQAPGGPLPDQGGAEPQPTGESRSGAVLGVKERVFSSLKEGQKRSLTGRKRIEKSLEPAFRSAVEKIVKKEKSMILKDARKILTNRAPSNLADRLREIYSEGDLPDFIERNLSGPVEQLFAKIRATIEKETGVTDIPQSDLDTIVSEYIRIYKREYIHSSLHQILNLIDEVSEDEIIDLIEARLDEWSEKRPDKEAQQETRRGANVFARDLYALAGVAFLTWITSGDPCPICDPLDGMRFPASSAPHGPLHHGCECSLSA